MSARERSVFVGNITYDTTESEVMPILAEVGQILSFKLVRDRETGKHKGYGFCQYTDLQREAAAKINHKLNFRDKLEI